MGLLDGIRSLLAVEQLQTRQVDPEEFASFDDRLAAVTAAAAVPWRQPTIKQALAVPSIFRAVSLLANTVGMLSMEAIRDGVTMPQRDAPRIVVRPNPFTIPREFWRETVWDMATRGEAWWWIASRDIDGSPLSLYPMPALEVTVEENERDLLRPTIRWRNRVMRNEDVRQLIFSRIPGDLRGSGPLQLCGAAVSVGVEAQTYAANFFAQGGVPSVLIKSADPLSSDEAENLKAQWAESAINTPRVIDPGIEDVREMGVEPDKAQLNETRRFAKGDVSDMFGIPGPFVNYVESGSSLTYQNIAQVYDQLLKACLLPNYVEPIEQTMSDLLTRSTVARFNTEALLRADIRTRYDVYASGITSGVLTVEEARTKEGLAPGDVERAPVPMAPPQAYPSILPIQQRSAAPIRCGTCNRLLAELAAPPYRFTCPKCKAVNAAEGGVETRSDDAGLRELAAAVTTLAMREQAAPVVTVHPPDIVVNTPPVTVTVEAPQPGRTEFEYDDAGRIVAEDVKPLRLVEEEEVA